jgi:hypothetical protein
MVHVQTSTFILLFASVFARILNVFSLNQTDKNLSVPSKGITKLMNGYAFKHLIDIRL